MPSTLDDHSLTRATQVGRPGGRYVPRFPSAIRGPWLTSVLGMVLLVGIPVEFLTGLFSYAAYNPKLAGNDPNPHHGLLGSYLFDWFTAPAWAFQAVQGIHVALGLALVPVVLAKLWSVIPKVFARPSFHSVAHALERATLFMLVGGVIFEMTTGIMDIDYFGPFGFRFYTGHFYVAWILMAGFVTHAILRMGRARATLKDRPLRDELRVDLARTIPDNPDAADLARPTISRRGLLSMVAGSSLLVVALTAGDSIGGIAQRVALLGTRDGAPGEGANHFPVNHTAAWAGITEDQVGDAWRLEVAGLRQVSLTRLDLLAMPLNRATLPIACTEGWSTTQDWIGVSLAHLAVVAGIPRPRSALLVALDGQSAQLSGEQVLAGESMLALKVNGADLSLDHGFPARVIVPSAPGTHNKKWMKRIAFEGQ